MPSSSSAGELIPGSDPVSGAATIPCMPSVPISGAVKWPPVRRTPSRRSKCDSMDSRRSKRIRRCSEHGWGPYS